MTFKPKSKTKTEYVYETFRLPKEWSEYLTAVLKEYPEMKRAQYMSAQFIHHLKELQKEEKSPININYEGQG